MSLWKREYKSNRADYDANSGTFNDRSETRYSLFGILVVVLKEQVHWEGRELPGKIGFGKQETGQKPQSN